MLTIRVETENGRAEREVFDEGLFDRFVPPAHDLRYRTIGFIDPYGNTVFNILQAPYFLEDLRRVAVLAERDDEKALIKELEAMGEIVAKSNHLYLKFIGD